MGSCVSISLPCDKVIYQASSCLCMEVAYIHNLEENIEELQIAMQKLRERRQDLLTRVRREENIGLQRLARVGGWLSRVEAIETRVDELLNARTNQIQRLCLCGYASKNCITGYQYGKEVFKKKEDVKSLESELRTFDEVAQEVPAPMVDERPIQPTVGTETMLEEAWRRLMADEVGIFGLYGMGGIGKTTLLTQINNKLCTPGNTFDLVIWVMVSKDLQVEKIQEDIGQKLGIINERWQHKRQGEKASDIYRVLSRRKFVLLLDDIWNKVNLAEIGVPFPSEENRCKVVFTTRSREVCGRMGVEDPMEVKCLAWDVAWDLFQKKVGENTLRSHPDISELAKIVAQKCRGLPLALNIVGETMASKRTIEEWRYSIDVLTSSAANFPGMEDEILPILKFSYDNLKEERVKSCFLYCALFPKGYNIIKRRLVNYWMCEGFIDGNKARESVMNEGFEIIGILLRACLLEEDERKGAVRMHDVVREMALWIASDFGKQEENFIIGFHQLFNVKNPKDVSRLSLMENRIESLSGVLGCPKLLTLLLNGNQLVNISGEFFLFMPSLVTLDLSYNAYLAEVPKEISLLVSLQSLNLSHTKIRQLPIGFQELRTLIYLELEYTEELQSVEGISSLTNLRMLKLLGTKAPFSLRLVEELQLLEHLNCLTISIGDDNVLKRFQSIQNLRSSTEILELKDITSTSDGISFMADLGSLRMLLFSSSNISEIKMDLGSIRNRILHNQRNPSNSCYPNLTHVFITSCEAPRDLTWLIFAPNVVVLFLLSVRGTKEIVSKNKLITHLNRQPNTISFGKLETLRLDGLPELESIYQDPLFFPSLKSFIIYKCPNLKRLPLNSTSVDWHRIRIEAEAEWVRGLEWEDEDTKMQVSQIAKLSLPFGSIPFSMSLRMTVNDM